MRLSIDPHNIDDYRKFLAVKRCPTYRFVGRTAIVPDEYAGSIGVDAPKVRRRAAYRPVDGLFDYQRDIAAMAIRKGKFAVFADCGLGKTLILLEFARHVRAAHPKQRCLIVSPLMVIRQTIEEARRFYGDDLPIERVSAHDLPAWVHGKGGVGITNYEAITDEIERGNLAGLILDESSMLKSHYGAWGTRLIQMGRGLHYKLALTGTPAPNDRIEFANHAVFVDAFPNVNSFLARFFVNRGQTGERWELKAHALRPFYRALSHWCIFLSNPATYGWKDNTRPLPPMHIHIDHVPMTTDQRQALMDLRGTMFVENAGGIGDRAKLAKIGKGIGVGGDTIDSNKPDFIRRLCDGFGDESALIWCKFNAEQDLIHETLPGSESIDGSTELEDREAIIDRFKSGNTRLLITKPKILGFGLNLQVATRQVFSGLQDSYEEFYQAVKRSNRYGSTKPLHVHIPVTELEEPMIQTVLAKAKRIEHDTREQEEMMREYFSA